MPKKPLKIFFESSVILGATQNELLEDPQLKIYVDKGLLDKPMRYTSPGELIELVLNLTKEKEYRAVCFSQSQRRIKINSQ